MEFLRCFLKVTETFIFKRRGNHQNAGWELALSIFALLLKIDHIIEQLWAIRTYQKSNREQFAQFAHDKRAIMSELLSISLKKSGISDSFVIRANCSHKTRDLIEKKVFSNVFDSVPPFYAQERIAPVALCSNNLWANSQPCQNAAHDV